jgi:hypothetical protein
MSMRKQISIMVEEEVLDAVDAIVVLRQQQKTQADAPVNRSRIIEHAILQYIEECGFDLQQPVKSLVDSL